MPRDIPIGNGKLLLTFDAHYQLRDFYFPHVGQENHAGAQPCRFGVWASDHDHPGSGQLSWTNDGHWKITQRYLRDTLTTSVSLDHADMGVSLYCNDAVDFHRRVFVRRIKVSNTRDTHRNIRLFSHQDFNMYGAKIGDTAYFDPDLQGLVSYRGQRWIYTSFVDERGKSRLDRYACGTSGFAGAEGTWRDAEDGHLQGNAVAQGAVDSTGATHLRLPPKGEATVYLVMIAGESRDELIELHGWMQKHTPQAVIDRTSAYWRLWVNGTNINFGNLPSKVVELFKRSLLVVRTQIDNGGAIVAANDTDIMQFARDTYSYVWPRDGALVADSLDLAGFSDLARSFYSFCQRTITKEGYFLHKYNPDESPASTWHPWIREGVRALPIQEDETALVVWALWRHYFRYLDIEFIRPLWVDVVQPAADFMCSHRDPHTGLPLPSYDLWEERWGVHAFTVATVYGGLKAAHNFAVAFGDRERAARYAKAAQEVQDGAAKHLWSEKHNRFVRRLNVVNRDGEVEVSPEMAGAVGDSTRYEIDPIVDAAMYAIFKFHLFEADDPRVVATMDAIRDRLWCKTDVGGVARYENDYYHRVSNDIERVPGNPWFICTMWLADYQITRATTVQELKQALPILEWTADHALASGCLAEQVNPYTNAPMSVSPLTWSHATVVSTSVKYLEKLQQLAVDATKRPVFQVRKTGAVEVRSHATFDRYDADFATIAPRETTVAAGSIDTAQTDGSRLRMSLRISQADCIGCGICVAACDRGVLTSIDSKALIDLRNLHACDQQGQCVTACPMNVITLEQTTIPAKIAG